MLPILLDYTKSFGIIKMQTPFQRGFSYKAVSCCPNEPREIEETEIEKPVLQTPTLGQAKYTQFLNITGGLVTSTFDSFCHDRS